MDKRIKNVTINGRKYDIENPPEVISDPRTEEHLGMLRKLFPVHTIKPNGEYRLTGWWRYNKPALRYRSTTKWEMVDLYFKNEEELAEYLYGLRPMKPGDYVEFDDFHVEDLGLNCDKLKGSDDA